MKNYKPFRKVHISLLITGFVQVYFVAVNTYLITRTLYVGVFAASFMVSFVWSYNVKRVAFGSIADRMVYATGTAMGSIAGVATSALVVSLF